MVFDMPMFIPRRERLLRSVRSSAVEYIYLLVPTFLCSASVVCHNGTDNNLIRSDYIHPTIWLKAAALERVKCVLTTVPSLPTPDVLLL